MEVRTYNYKLYILMLLGVCGEIEKELLIKNIGHPTHTRQHITELKREKYITETPAKIIRLKKPRGYEVIKDIPELFIHYNEITNNHTFKSKVERTKKGSLFFVMLMNGIQVNGFNVSLTPQGGRPKKNEKEIWKDKYETMGQGIKNEDKYRNIILNMQPDETNYFPSILVKRHKAPTLRINPSRAKGHLINIERSIAVYWRTSETGSYSKKTETVFQEYTEAIYREAFGWQAYEEKKSQTPYGEAIIFTNTDEDILEIIKEQELIKETDGTTADLWDVYTEVYMLPLESPQKLHEILTQKRSEHPLLKKAGLEKTFDTIIDDTFTLDLRIANAGKIHRAKKYLSEHDTNLFIICDKNHEHIYKDIFKDPKFIKGGNQ